MISIICYTCGNRWLPARGSAFTSVPQVLGKFVVPVLHLVRLGLLFIAASVMTLGLSGCEETSSVVRVQTTPPPADMLRPKPRPSSEQDKVAEAAPAEAPKLATLLKPKSRPSSAEFAAKPKEEPQKTDNPDIIKVTVNNQAFFLEAPNGYCFDKSNSGPRGRFGFVLLGGCKSNQINGILATSIGESSLPALVSLPSALSRFFNTEEGRAQLSESGNGKDVEVLDKKISNNILFLRVKDRVPRIENTSRTIWRSFFRASGHIFAVSYLPITGRKSDEAAEYELLRSFVTEMRQMNLLRL